MMVGTLITEDNADQFLAAVDRQALIHSDFFVGVVDDETNTAVGVLSAEAIRGHTLSIRYIFVKEEQRRKGAGRALVSTLLEAAGEIEASSVVCPLVRSEEEYGIRELLLSAGFFLDERDRDEVVLLTYTIDDMA